MYSTGLAHDKRSEKTPKSQTKRGDGLSEMWTKKGLTEMVTLGQRLNHKASQDGMTRIRAAQAGAGMRAEEGRADTPCCQDPGSISRSPSILTGKWWSGEHYRGSPILKDSNSFSKLMDHL